MAKKKKRTNSLNRLNKTNRKKTRIIVISAIALLVLIAVVTVILVLSGGKKIPASETGGVTTIETTTETTTAAPETEPPIEYPEPSFAHGTAFSFVRRDMGKKPVFTDPLTGLEADQDLSSFRPVAIMINNIEQAMPQVGISNGDIVYECLAEGGITRLLMVTRNYENLGTVGSIRSSREYYIDFAKNHDAIYVHAGGSEEAYAQMKSRQIEHLDGVNADPISGKNISDIVFYRDPERLKTMSKEHTMVTTGARMADGILEMGYSTVLREDFTEPVVPVDWGWSVSLNGEDATHVKIPYNSKRISEYEYDEMRGSYLRYQYDHQRHIDGTTNAQLSFENIVILEMSHRDTGDDKGHLVIETVGEGDGWFITGGKRIPIRWAKPSQDLEMTLSDMEGNPIIVNQGKTVINIVSSTVNSSVTFN